MKPDWKGCLKLAVSVFVLYLCIHYWPQAAALLSLCLKAAMPLLIGCVLAYILNILMSAYERRFFPSSKKTAVQKLRRPVCVVGAIITLLAIIALVLVLVIPQLISCFQLIFDQLPGFLMDLLHRIERLGILPEDVIATLESIDWQSQIGKIAELVTSGVGDVVNVLVNAVSSVFSGLVTALVSIIFSVYLLVSKERLQNQVRRISRRYLPPVWFRKLRYFVTIFNDCFRRYIVGQCTEAVILGVLCMLGMAILRLPYAAMVGALVAFTALIPVVGAFVGAGVGAFMILMVDPIKALIFLIFILVLQQLENNLIYPKVVGASLGLPGIWVLAAVTVGGGVLGVAGMLLGVPATAVLYRLLREDVQKSEVPAPNDPEPPTQPE